MAHYPWDVNVLCTGREGACVPPGVCPVGVCSDSRHRGRAGSQRPVVDDDKRAAILARRERRESIRTIAAGVKGSIGVVHKTLTDAKTP